MPDTEELWIPLVDEPIGSIVQAIVEENPEVAKLVESPHRILAFRTFAYIRCGLLLGQLLFDNDVPAYDGSESWVDALLKDPAHHQALTEEVRTVARRDRRRPEVRRRRAARPRRRGPRAVPPLRARPSRPGLEAIMRALVRRASLDPRTRGLPARARRRGRAGLGRPLGGRDRSRLGDPGRRSRPGGCELAHPDRT